jgi:NAD(P)-dependent dehydrogenase (short-subunit alcohol dehydrogenase family)
MSERRVALITGSSNYVGPALSRLLAARGHDLVLGDPTEDLIRELADMGATVEAVAGTTDLADPASSRRLAQAAIDRFGRLDSAVSFTGAIVTGRFMKSTPDDFNKVLQGCMMAPYNFLHAVLQPMIEHGDGQVLVITSATASRATPGAPLYSAARAGATHLVRNVAGEVARNRIQVNAVGTNFMEFPDFLRANGITDAESRAKVEAMVPLGRLGSMEEFASFCMPYVDGTSRFTTGQFTSYSGGWS